MKPARGLVPVLLLAVATTAQAQSLSTASLPSFARYPAAFAPGTIGGGFDLAPSWSNNWGFSSGSAAAFGSVQSWSGYSHKFSNDTFVSVRSFSGYSQDLFQRNGVGGYNFSGSEVRYGFDAGRLRPFIGASAVVANPVSVNPFVATNTMGASLFGQSGSRSFTSVKAGFDFKVSDKITFGAAVSATATDNRGGVSPLVQPGMR